MTVELLGDKSLLKKFATLPDRLQRKHVRRGVTKAARRTAKEAKGKVPTETKTLKLSIGQRVRTRRGVVLAAVGPRRNMGRMVSAEGRGGKTRQVFRNPTRYAHLVEFGSSEIQPQPFMRPAYDATKQSNLAVIRSEIQVGIEAEAVRS